ncbi:MAG: nucleotidyltransferase [Sedimenticola sp.]
MSTSEMFSQFISNLAINNEDQISLRYGEITSALNKKFRDTESKTANTVQVGSYGRRTAIKGISDLDMVYIMPKSTWETYKDGKQLKLLQDAKAAIDSRYPKTKTRVDRQVVVVTFQNFEIEVVPAFEQDDGSFKCPDSYDGGRWYISKPREEIEEISRLNNEKNRNLKRLAKMVRAWRNKHGITMGGLLIDTLAYNFLQSTDYFDNKSYFYYDVLSRDFFEYLANQPNQDYYAAPGSGQRVNVKKRFQKKAKKAYELCVKAIAASGQKNENDKWRKVYGRDFPAYVEEAAQESKAARTWRDTEEFIEDYYPVDIRYSMSIDCDVSQNGFREHSLAAMLLRKLPLLADKRLRFFVTDIPVPSPYTLHWKVLNRGDIARQRDEVRGQIIPDEGHAERRERTSFRGPHLVECYAIKNGVVVARDSIDVPIQ